MNKLLVTKDVFLKSNLRAYNLNAHFETPNIDKVFSNGSIFLNHYSTAPSTAMSLASIISGMFPYQFGRSRYSKKSKSLNVETIFEKVIEKNFKPLFIVPEYWKNWKEFINAFKGVDFVYFVIDELADLNTFVDKYLKLDSTNMFVWIHLPHVMRPAVGYNSDINLLDQFFGLIDSSSVFDEIYLSADHGHMDLNKGIMNYGFDLYQSVINVPLLSSKSFGSYYVNELTSHVDMFDIIFGDKIIERDYVVSETAYRLQGHRKIAIINQQYKLIFNKLTGRIELYDYLFDQHEKRDLMINKKWDFYRGKYINYKGISFYPYEELANNSLQYLRGILEGIYKPEPFIIELFLKLSVIGRMLYLPVVNYLNLRKFFRWLKPIKF